MTSKIELYISGNTVAIGQVDLFGDEPIQLNYSIADIKDISKRNSSFSQEFTVPATKNNNQLFNHIFNIGSDSRFDPSKKTPAYLLVDNLPVFNGSLQLTKIKVKDKNPESYNIVIYGETADLVKTLGDSYLTDLDFSELNHSYTVDNIINSWTANTESLGYYYPLIDYGYDLDADELNSGILTGSSYTAYTSTGTGLNPTIFKPAISTKYLFDKIFDNAGYTYQSDFLRSEIFNQLIIPFNGKDVDSLPDDFLETIAFRAGLSTDLGNGGGLGTKKTPFNNDSTGENFDNGGLYDTSTYKYMSNGNLSFKFAVDLDIDYEKDAYLYLSERTYETINVYFFRSSLTGATYATGFPNCFTRIDITVPNNVIRKRFSVESTPLTNTSTAANNFNYPAVPGETFWAYVIVYGGPNKTARTRLRKDTTAFYNIPLSNLCVNGPVYFNSYIPKKIKQIDYIKSIITMFNLMVVPQKDNPKRLTIEPRPHYYQDGTVKDWTNKIDLREGFEEVLISEQQARKIMLSYKQDNDLYNTSYKEDTLKVYGEYSEIIDNEWIDPSSEQKIEVIFSPTPMDNVIDADEIVIPKIGKMESNGFGKTESNIRILRKNPELMPTRYNTITMLGKQPIYGYPYAGHLDHPFLSNIDYNFGLIDYAYYNTPGFPRLQQITDDNLVNLYWKDYFDAINDKNAKLITCKIKLTPADMAQFNYNDIIYIEGLTDDGGHYFIVNRIDYIPTSDMPCTVELIKFNKK